MQKYKVEINICVVLQEAKQSGRREGKSRLAKLIHYLLSSERTDDAMRVTKDEEYRRKLYHEFKITE